MQTGTSIGHMVVPVVQGLPVLQTVPSKHSLHTGPMQIPEVPQPVPGGTSSSSTHTGEPEPQSLCPVVQGLPVLHTVPS